MMKNIFRAMVFVLLVATLFGPFDGLVENTNLGIVDSVSAHQVQGDDDDLECLLYGGHHCDPQGGGG